MRISRALVIVGAVMMAGSAFGACRDPWVGELVQQMKARPPIGTGDIAECNFKLYGSNWNSRQQLTTQMQATFAALKNAGLEFQSEKVMRDLTYFTMVHAYDPAYYVGPRAGSPYADQTRTAGGTYWWHVPLPNDHVLVVARKCRRGWRSAGPGANSGCVQ